jgi:hypothetical protein
MTHRVSLAACYDAASRSATWLRNQYQIPPDQELFTRYTEEFGIQVETEYIDSVIPQIYLTFPSELDYCNFLLKWS